MKKADPLENIYHIQLLRGFFKTIGAWPTELFGEKSRRKINTFFVIGVTCVNITGEFNYLSKKIHYLSFIDLGELYLTLFLTFMTLVLAILPALERYGIIIKEFITEFHMINFKHKNEYYQKIYKNTDRFSYFFTLLMLAYSIFGPIFFNLVPLVNNYRNGVYSQNIKENTTIQFSVYFLYSFYNPQDHVITASLINLYLSYFCALLVCGVDLLMSLMAFQIIAHIKALIHDLRSIPKPKRPIQIEVNSPEGNTTTKLYIELYDAQENLVVHDHIVDLVKHHRLIVSFAGAVSEFFGPLLALTYLYHLVSCALLLLECSQMDIGALARYGPLTAIIFYQLIQISITFEVIGSESDKLKDEVYVMPWECMSNSNQKLVWIFLNRIQIPIRVTALGMVEVGVQAMVAILKTTFSYFALLRSFGEV